MSVRRRAAGVLLRYGTLRHCATALAGLVCLLAPAAGLARAQDAATQDSRPLRWSMGPYYGMAKNSPAGKYFGVTPDRDHYFFGVHATVELVTGGGWTFSYAPELVPVLVLTNNPTYRVLPYDDGHASLTIEGAPAPVLGFAFSPVGIEGSRRVSTRSSLYAAGAIGGVLFTRQTPVLNSRAFNYTFEFGGGVLYTVAPAWRLRVGYKFHHLSNAKSAIRNPGVDGKVVLVGVERTFGR